MDNTRYPRICKNGHSVLGPKDETNNGEKWNSCLRCKRASRRRYAGSLSKTQRELKRARDRRYWHSLPWYKREEHNLQLGAKRRQRTIEEASAKLYT